MDKLLINIGCFYIISLIECIYFAITCSVSESWNFIEIIESCNEFLRCFAIFMVQDKFDHIAVLNSYSRFPWFLKVNDKFQLTVSGRETQSCHPNHWWSGVPVPDAFPFQDQLDWPRHNPQSHSRWSHLQWKADWYAVCVLAFINLVAWTLVLMCSANSMVRAFDFRAFYEHMTYIMEYDFINSLIL